MSDDHEVVTPGPSDGRQPATSRSGHIRVKSVELISLAGTAGDELEARQDAAIREVLLWLQRRQGHAPLR